VQRKDAPLFTCQEEAGGDASFGLVSRVSSSVICSKFFLQRILASSLVVNYTKPHLSSGNAIMGQIRLLARWCKRHLNHALVSLGLCL